MRKAIQAEPVVTLQKKREKLQINIIMLSMFGTGCDILEETMGGDNGGNTDC